MAVVSSKGWFNSKSALSVSWLLEVVKASLLKAALVNSKCTVTDVEPERETLKAVENRCHEGGEDDPSGGNVSSACTSRGAAEGLDLETSELKRMFQKLDENQDDLICAADLRRFMGRLGFELSEEEAVAMLSTIDHNGDGNVGFEEFCTLYRSLDEGTDSCRNGEKQIDDDEDETLLEAFRVFDKNNDGFISCKELQEVLLALGLSEGKSIQSCELMIKGVDVNGDGEVDIKEFKQMMSSNSFSR